MTVQTNQTLNDLFSNRLCLFTKYLVRAERTLAVGMLCIILVTMGVQVFARYVFNMPFSWSEELSRFAMVWMSFLAATFIMAEGNHIAVDIWTVRVTSQTSRKLQLVSYLVVAISCAMLFVGGLRFVLKVHPVGSSSLGIPKSIWYSAVSIALLLMAFHSLVNFLLVIRTGRPYVSEYFVLDEGATNQPKASDEQSPQNSEVTS